MRLEIGELMLDCLVPQGHVDETGVRLACEGLARRLPEHLAPRLPARSDGIGMVLIRELTFDVTLNLDCPRDICLEALGDALLQALARSMATGGQGQVRFANGAEQLAAFIGDLLDGDAWSLWYHRPFDGLRHLPKARALATALSRDAGVSLVAVARLGGRRIEELAAEAGAEVIIALADECLATGSGMAPDEEEAAAMWRMAQAANATFESAFLAALAAAAGEGGLPGETAIAMARDMALAASKRSDTETQSFDGASAAVIHPSVALAKSPLAAQALVSRMMGSASSRTEMSREGTRFGGLFLLLRDLDAVSQSLLLSGSACGDLDAGQALRILVLAHLAGDGRVTAWFTDEAWRGLLGIGRAVMLADVVAWANDAACSMAVGERDVSASPVWRGGLAAAGLEPAALAWIGAMAEDVMAGFSRRLPGFSESSVPYLQRNVLDVAASLSRDGDVLLVEVDRPPLDPLLALSGAGDWEQRFAWTEPERIAVMRRR